MARSRVIYHVAFALITGFAVSAPALASQCEIRLTAGHNLPTDPTALMHELVQLASKADKGAQYDELFAAYRTATGLSDQDINDAISMQVAMIEASSKRPGEGAITEQDEADALKAYEFAKENAMLPQAAFMLAIKSGKLEVVRGFLVISRQQSNVCKGQAGYGRFCKDLDLTKGWNNEGYLIEAAKSSKEIALLLTAEGLSVPIAQLNEVKHGDELALLYIEAGQRIPFSEALARKTDAVTLKLLEKGEAFSADDLNKAMQLGKKGVVLEALKLHPQLASAQFSDGSFPLFYAAANNDQALVELLLNTYKVDVNQLKKNGETALFASVALHDPKIFNALLDAGADIHVVTPAGWSVLHNAALKYTRAGPEYVRELVLAGVKLDQKAKIKISYGRTKSQQAKDVQYDEVTPGRIAYDLYYRSGSDDEGYDRIRTILEILRKNGGGE